MVVPSMAGFANYMAPILVGAPDIYTHITLMDLLLKVGFYDWVEIMLMSAAHNEVPRDDLPEEVDTTLENSASPSSINTNYNGLLWFPSWLAGIWEGDGSSWVPTTEHAPSGKLYTVNVTITFALVDLPLAKWLDSILGGYVRLMTDQGACRLVIANPYSVANFIRLVSPWLRTPKLGRLNAVITWLEANKNIKLSYITPCTTSLLQDAWLAGFLDADGNFYVRVTLTHSDRELVSSVGSGLNLDFPDTNPKKSRAGIRIRIEQRIFDGFSNGPIVDSINAIAKALHVNKILTTQHNGRSYWSVEATSLVSTTVLFEYLDRFPLITAKRFDSLDAKNAFLLITRNGHTTTAGRARILTIQYGINRRRNLSTIS